jgi:hypothetical protein
LDQFIRLRRNTLQLVVAEPEIPPGGAAGLKGKVNRTTCLDGVLMKSEAHQSEGALISLYHFIVEMATAQFRFDTPTACGGELHLFIIHTMIGSSNARRINTPGIDK